MKNQRRFNLCMGLVLAIIIVNIPLLSHAQPIANEVVYLPLIIKAPPPTTNSDLIENGSFEMGWADLPPAPGFLINQQPNGWQITWVEPGQPIFGSNDVAQGVPECVHKLEDQLPPDEQPGGPDALILDGAAVYKIFHFGAAFGTELEQVVTGLQPEQQYRVTVPIQIHGVDSDEWGAESGVWVDGVGQWVNQRIMGDRTWYNHTLEFTALPSGEARVTIRVKSKYNMSKDFFIDAVRLEVVGVAH